jgi:ubiquinone/menaquinone biosynthesis C-methylase UbiE
VEQVRSYAFDRFTDHDRQAEIRRLHLQATMLWDREWAVLTGLGLHDGQAVLEIGCGPGFIAGGIAAGNPSGTVTGIDTSVELLDVARTVVQPERPNLSVQAGNAYATSLPDGAFDFVYNRLIYQHLDQPLRALEEARRVTRPGGTVCVMDIDDGWLTIHPQLPAFDTFTAMAAGAQTANGGDRHIARKLPGLMAAAGFHDIALTAICVSSLDIGMAAFLDITTRFKAIQIGTAEAFAQRDAVMAAVAAAEAEGPVFAMVGAFFAVGRA